MSLFGNIMWLFNEDGMEKRHSQNRQKKNPNAPSKKMIPDFVEDSAQYKTAGKLAERFSAVALYKIGADTAFKTALLQKNADTVFVWLMVDYCNKLSGFTKWYRDSETSHPYADHIVGFAESIAITCLACMPEQWVKSMIPKNARHKDMADLLKKMQAPALSYLCG